MHKTDGNSRLHGLHLLAWAVAVLFASQLFIAFFLPIYTDEFGFKWGYARAFLDGGKMQLFTISCRADPTAAWPLLWMPARWLDAFMYEDLSHPTKLRVFGFVYAGIFLIALFSLVRRACSSFEGAPASLVYVFALSFCALGVLPFLLVMNRPEIELMGGVAVLLVLVLRGARVANIWLVCAGLALLQYYLFAHHPKAILLIPLFIASWLALRGSAGLKFLGVLWIGILAVSLYTFYFRLLQCPLDNYVRINVLRDTLSVELLRVFPEYFIWQGLNNLFGSLQYVSSVTFRAEYTSSWLPTDELRSHGLAGVANPGIEIMWLLPLLSSVVGLVTLIGRTTPAIRTSLREQERAVGVVFVGLVTSLALTCIAQINRNDYKSTQILLLVLLCAVLALISQVKPIKQHIWRKMMGAAFVICIVSQIVFFRSFATYATANWLVPGPTIGQPFSVSHVGYGAFRTQVASLARECGFSEHHPPEHLVLDDSTYPVFWRSRLPYHLVYLTGGWAGGIRDLKALLEERRYGGIVSKCTILPLSLRKMAKEENGICCVQTGLK